MKLVWTRPAREDRKAIREYIAVDNPSAALDLDELLSEKTARLLDHPGLGRLFLLLLVIVSVMVSPFQYHLMTLHTK